MSKREFTVGIKGFRKWLMSKPEGEEVGRTGKVMTCPIAVYITEQMGGDYGAAVTVAMCSGRRSSIITPAWAKRFIPRADCLYPVEYRKLNGHLSAYYEKDKPVTREQALAILDGIEGE